MFCTKCGKEIPGDSKFCDYCGTEQIPATVTPASAKSTVEFTLPLSKLKFGGASTAGLVMAFLGTVISGILRLMFQERFYPYMYLPKGYKGLIVILAIMFSAFSILLSANDKVKNKDSRMFPVIIASIVCLGISLLVILIEINIKSGNY